MKERCEKDIELGLIKNSNKIVEEIEKCAIEMREEGWYFLESKTETSLNIVKLLFEREIDI